MNINSIFAYENGELDSAQTVALFQQLLDTGVLGHLQGSYGRQAQRFLDEGLITHSPNHAARKRAAKRGRKAKAPLDNYEVV